MSRIFLCLLPMITFTAVRVYAVGDTSAKRGIVLVMLHAEKNRITAAQKINNKELQANIEHDAEQVRIRTIMDFTENLTVYPVYYVMDSNYDKIKLKQFGGIVMNADGSIANNVAIDTARPNYIIVYYGTGDFKNYSNSATTEQEENGRESGVAHGLGLVIYNSKLQQLTHFYKMAYANPSVLPLEEAKKLSHDRPKRYFYKSKSMEIEYYPFARELNRSFRKKTRRESSLPY